ncbi:hypothetical protein GCM10027030_00450 [Luteococcus sediminum]
MTIPPLPTPIAQRPRNGFIDDDHDVIIAMAQEGASLTQIGNVFDKTVKSIETRARKLLPPGQRKIPSDRVLPTLAIVSAEPGYDWRSTIAQDDPLPPVNEIVHTGIAGLSDDQLVTCAHAVAVCLPHGPGFDELLAECNRRRLGRRIVTAHAAHRRLQESPNPDQAEEISEAWAEEIGFHAPHRNSWM